MKAIYVNQYEVKKLGKYVEYEGRIYTKPEIAYPEIVEALGYKNLEIEPVPEYDPTEFLIKCKYTDLETKILGVWELYPAPNTTA